MSSYEKERYKLRCEVWGDFAQPYERAAAAGTPIRQLATTIEIVFEYAGPLYLLQELCRQIEDGPSWRRRSHWNPNTPANGGRHECRPPGARA